MLLLEKVGFRFLREIGMEKIKQQTSNSRIQIKFNAQILIFKQPVFINSIVLESWKLKYCDLFVI